MIKIHTYILAFLFLTLMSCSESGKKTAWPYDVLEISKQQYNMLTENLEENTYPTSISGDGSLQVSNSKSWVSGFFPGTLWYLFKYSEDANLKKNAILWTEGIKDQATNTGTHDLGFMFMSSYGNGLEIGGLENYKEILMKSAQSLKSRYNPNVGCIKSWDFFNGKDKWQQFPVIMDNMMNLELLFKATEISGDSSYYEIAVSHADKTMTNHIRDNYSSYHVVDYDTITGEVIKKMTSQGFADQSTWARGQAWGIAGFTMCYKYTQEPKYLNTALKLLDYYQNNETMPKNQIPFWDFDDPEIPNVSRDASSAAIVASALLDLSQFVDPPKSDRLFKDAEFVLKNLSSEEYLAEIGTQNGFILKHSTGHRPLKKEIDKPICYADYYFVKALVKYLEIIEDKESSNKIVSLEK